MNISKLKKDFTGITSEERDELLEKYVVEQIASIDVSKYIRNGKLATNNLVSKIRNDINQITNRVNHIK